MASYCEPMDVDEVPVDSDNKENAFHHNRTGEAPRTPHDKMCEDLDVSEMNMKLRMSCTPLVSSALEKRFTGSAKKLFTGSEAADLLNDTAADNGNITAADWSMNNVKSSDSIPASDSTHSGINTESDYGNKTAVFDTTKPTAQNGEGLSQLQSHVPKATSPILRGISSVLNMFRPSQSPISSRNDSMLDTQNDSIPDITINSVQVSTPVPDSEKNRKSYQSASKTSSNSTNSIVFSEDLVNDLQWNDDSTIIFNTEKMPNIQSGSSFNSRASVPSVHSYSETEKKPNEGREVENTTTAVVPETTVEKMDMSVNCSNFKCPSQLQENCDEKLFAKKKIEELKETANSVLEYVIMQAQTLVDESFTKEKSKVNQTIILHDNAYVEHLEVVSQHAEDNTMDSEQVVTEKTISSKYETSSILTLNPNLLHTHCEIEHSFDNKNDISQELVTNASEKDFQVSLNSNINMSTPSNVTQAVFEAESSFGKTTESKEIATEIESSVVDAELCSNEENFQNCSMQAGQGEHINEEIITSENTSPFISLNTLDKNIELESEDIHQKLNYDKNPFATVLKIEMSPPRSDVNFEEIKNPLTPKAITSKISPQDVSENYGTYTIDTLHTTMDNIDTYPNQVNLSLQGSGNHISALESLSESTPSGSDNLQGETSDAYLSADSGRESEQLLDNEMEQIDKDRDVITPTPVINTLDENETICLSPNCGKMLLSGSNDIENCFDISSKTNVSQSGVHNNSVCENNEVFADAENVPEEVDEVASLTLNSCNMGETMIIISDKLSSETTVKPNEEQVLDNSRLPKLKQEEDKKEEAVSEEKGENQADFQHNQVTDLTHKGIACADSSECDGSHNITHIVKGVIVDLDVGIKLNAVKNQAEIYEDILNIDEIPDQKIEESISDGTSEPDLAMENPFAATSRLSKSPLKSFNQLKNDNTSDTRVKTEISSPTTPTLPSTMIDKEVEIVDLFDKNKVRLSLCQNEISEKNAITNTKFGDERQHTIDNLDTDGGENIDNKINNVENSPQAKTSTSSESSPEGDVTVREVHTEDEDTMEGPDFEVDLDNSFHSTIRVKSSKDQNKSEIKPLQVIMCEDVASTEAAMVDLPPEEEFMECQDEEFRPGELFINADTFEFLMSQGKAHNTDYGKESLFLKFDPLCARRSSAGTNEVSMKLDNTLLHQPEVIPEESPIAQAETLVQSHKTPCETVTSTPENSNIIRNKRSTPVNGNTTSDLKITPEDSNTTADVTSASESVTVTKDVMSTSVNFNTTRNVTSGSEYENTTRDVAGILENLNIATDVPTSMLNICSNEKPTMAVPPSTVNTETSVVNRTAPYTPVRTERRSMTFSSPAIAAIDRLISLSGNNSPVSQTYYVENTMSQETREAVVQTQDLLTAKEAEVNELKQESKELQDKLVDLDIQMRNIQEDNEERLRKIEDLKAKLTHKTAMNNNMSAAVAEYERAVASMITDNEEERKRYELEKANLIRERDEQISHLNSMEGSFSDLHTKYERTKQLILTFKANEEILRRTINEYKERTEKLEHNYESLKQQAISQLNNANMELDKLKRSHEAEVLKLNAQMRRKELHVASLEESLAQKIKANEELTAICDEIISKVG